MWSAKATRIVFCILFLISIVEAAYSQEALHQSIFKQLVKSPDSKLSFRLAALSESPALSRMSAEAQGPVLSLPPGGPGSMMRDAQGRILVEIRMSDISDEQIQSLRKAGAAIRHISDRYQTVTALVDPSYLSSMASLSSVQNVMEVLRPQTNSTCPAGIAMSEGDTQLYASLARSNYSLDGTGVQVGVLSDSYNKYSSGATTAPNDVTNGDLPGPSNTCGFTAAVNVLYEYSDTDGEDEGRGMMQIVHDLAPGSTKSFATAFESLTSFADYIRALRTAGADIIVDDVTDYTEPLFQEGPVNVAIADVVNSGALYFTSAGNANLIIGGNNVSSYEAPGYRPTTCPSALGLSGDCHNFEPNGGVSSSSRITLSNGCSVRINFQWNEPWYGVATDLNIYLVNSGDTVVAYSVDDNISTQKPFEFLSYTNSSGSSQDFRIVIARHSGTAAPRLKYVFMQGGNTCMTGVQYNTSSGGDIVGPSLVGHSATKYGFSVGAVPYNNSNAPEDFSSRGPATHYYGPVSGTTAAPAITADVLQQPDFAATDGGCTSFFGSYSSSTCYRFYGTSAAAPHAAAVTALLKQRANQLSMPLTYMVGKYLLQSAAQAVSGGDLYSVGAGMINANAAVAKLASLGPVIRVQNSTIVADYSSIQTAYNNSNSSGDIIEMLATTFTENLSFTSAKDVTLRGGYTAGYPSQSGNTTVHGNLTISSGKVTADGLLLK